eukprot:4002829-Prymnesium_polylepis.1
MKNVDRGAERAGGGSLCGPALCSDLDRTALGSKRGALRARVTRATHERPRPQALTAARRNAAHVEPIGLGRIKPLWGRGRGLCALGRVADTNMNRDDIVRIADA